MIKLLVKLSFRFIFHKNEGLLRFVSTSFKLSIVALSLSIFSIIILNSFSIGYKSAVEQKMNDYYSDLEIMTISKSTFERIITQIDTNFSENFYYIATMSSPGILIHDNFNHGVEVISCIYDSCPEKIETNHIILGSNTYKKINTMENNEVYIINPQSMIQNLGFNKKISKFKVSSNELDYALPQERYKVLISADNFFNLYENDISDISYSIKLFYKNLNHDHHGDYSLNQFYENLVNSFLVNELNTYYTISFEDRFANLSDSIDQIFTTISIILYFFIVLSATNIISSVWLIIESKKKQIKLLTLMGFSKFYIFVVILLLIFSLVSISFITGYAFSEFVLYLQNSYNILTIPGDVYIISSMNLKIDRTYILKFFVLLNLIGVFMSLFPYFKVTSSKNIHV